MRKVSSANSCETRVVYIVDEDGAVREGLFRLMLSAGFEARVFGTLEQFLAEVEPGASGCMLLDMPRASTGTRPFRERLRESGIDMPVIELSAHDDQMTRRSARRRGAYLLLNKPVDDQALLDAINWVLEKARTHPLAHDERG